MELALQPTVPSRQQSFVVDSLTCLTMRIKDLLAAASKRFPNLAENLTLEQLVHFCAIGSDFIRRTYALFPTSATSAPIEFLRASLPAVASPSYWAQLWMITHPHLFACHLNPEEAFRKLGIPSLDRPVNSLVIPEHVFSPPVDHCPHCDPAKHRRLTSRPAKQGYVYDLDGVRTVLHQTKYCRCSYFFYIHLLH